MEKKSIHFLKTLILVNIILTTAIFCSKNLYLSLVIWGICFIVVILSFGWQKMKDDLLFLLKFKYLFLSLVVFQVLLRRKGDILYEFLLVRITTEGIFYALNSLFRFFVIIICSRMFAEISTYTMIKALRSWKIPEMFIIVISFTIQFFHQLNIDFKILKNNMLRRKILFHKRSLKQKLALGSQILVPLLIHLFTNLKYKVIALELNGYNAKKEGE